jgi:hypothetical protein
MNRSRASGWCLGVCGAVAAMFVACSATADEPAKKSAAPVANASAPDELKALALSVNLPPRDVPRKHDFLLRELPRQALLIAARDELHLATRDEMLREPLPGGVDPRKLPFSIVSLIPGEFRTADYTRAKLTVYRTGVAEPAWQKEYELDPDHFLEQLAERCGELSRTEFVTALAPGQQTKAKWADADPPLTDDVERQLAEMDFIGQFAAARTLHRLMREEGESPQRLGALVRAYANLGLLTDFFVAPAHKVFMARSLVYAERLLAHDRASPVGWWHRAYARALTGLHAAAITDLEAAEKLLGDAKSPAPEWVDLVDGFCRFDEGKVSDAADRSQLAAVLRLRSLAFAKRYSAVTSLAERLLQDCPDCYFAIDSIYELRSLGTGRMAAELGPQAAQEWLAKRLSGVDSAAAQMAQMAEAIDQANQGARQKAQNNSRIQLIRGLRAAGSVEADDSEPSLGALAALVEDLTFLHAMIRIEFYGEMLDVPTEDLINEARPLVADHPFRAFIDAQSKNMERRREAAKVIRETPGVPEIIENSLRPLAAALNSVDRELLVGLSEFSVAHNDLIFQDLLQMDALYGSSPDMKTYVAKKLRSVSPHAPTAVAMQINYDWPSAEGEAAELEKRYAASPEVLSALGMRYQQLERFDDAERCFKQCVATAPDTASYQRLANLYWQKGDIDDWKAAIDRALEQETFGLEHARLRVNVANYYISRKDYDAALPYAQAAAQTGAAWAMFCEANCWEGKQDWDKAERMIRFIVERYDNVPLDWIYFCKRTGKGDVKGAIRLAERFIARSERKEVNADPFFLGGAYIMVGKPQQAFAVFEGNFQTTKNPSPGMLAALLADQLKDDKARDRLLSEVVADGPKFKLPTGKPRAELLQFAQWMIDDLAKGGKGDLDLVAIDKLLAETDENERLIGEHLLGRYLSLHGKRDQAIAYWKRAMGSAMLTNFHRTMSGNWLHELGVTADDYQRELLAKPPDLKASEAKKQ